MSERDSWSRSRLVDKVLGGGVAGGSWFWELAAVTCHPVALSDRRVLELTAIS